MLVPVFTVRYLSPNVVSSLTYDTLSSVQTIHPQDTDMVLPANVQGRPQGQGLQQGHHQAGGRGWKEDFGSRQKKEPPLDLSGPRARLYMPVDKVVAACGKGGDAFEGNTKPTGRRSNLEDGPARTERGPVCKGHPQQEVRNRSPPFNMITLSPPHAPLVQGCQVEFTTNPTGRRVSSPDFQLRKRSGSRSPSWCQARRTTSRLQLIPTALTDRHRLSSLSTVRRCSRRSLK